MAADTAGAPDAPRRRFSRRQVLFGGAVAAAAIVGTTAALRQGAKPRGAAPSHPRGPGKGGQGHTPGPGQGPDDVPGPRLPPGPRGAVRWQFESFGDGALTPTYDAGVLYAGGAAGYALQASTGRALWTFDAEDPVSIPVSAPACAAGTVFFAATSLYALDTATGNTRWRQAAPAAGSPAFGDPVHAGGRVFAGFGESLVRAFDAATGDEQWRAAVGGFVLTSPTVADGRLFVSTSDAKVQAFDAATGRRLWTHGLGRPFDVPVAVADGIVYVGAADFAPPRGQGSALVHGIRALDAATGAPRWAYRTVQYPSNVAVAGGVAYFGTASGTVIALDAATGRLVWRRDELPEAGSGISLVDGTLYVSGDRSFSALEAASGAVRWSGVSPEFFGLSPVVIASDGLAVVCDDSGRLTAFAPPSDGAPV
ncbi:PQQ-binding-like beta-propeller repeat protein [Uniformispora flossi]|uniref:outer membrane protein assembly factor BamB family protein n=1 Tax=Uniformispora flossi TaxID=3390723 RepID=UPI003C2F9172